MVKKLLDHVEGSDFDTDESSAMDAKPSRPAADRWEDAIDTSASVSSHPGEFHDNPGHPAKLRSISDIPPVMENSGPTQSDLTLFAIFYTAAQVVGIICIVLVWIWMSEYLGGFAWSSNSSLQFNYHPLFMVIGMVFLYGNAILVYRVLRSTRKLILKFFHASLHLLAFIFAVTALNAVFGFHNAKEIPNLYTFHSWMGLITVILFAGQYVFGFFSFLYPGLAKSLRIRMLPLHAFFGLMIFLMGIGCCITGMTAKVIWTLGDDYKNLEAPAGIVNCLGLCLVLFAILVVFLATSSRFKRQPLPEEAMLQLEPQSPAY